MGDSRGEWETLVASGKWPRADDASPEGVKIANDNSVFFHAQYHYSKAQQYVVSCLHRELLAKAPSH